MTMIGLVHKFPPLRIWLHLDCQLEARVIFTEELVNNAASSLPVSSSYITTSISLASLHDNTVRRYRTNWNPFSCFLQLKLLRLKLGPNSQLLPLQQCLWFLNSHSSGTDTRPRQTGDAANAAFKYANDTHLVPRYLSLLLPNAAFEARSRPKTRLIHSSLHATETHWIRVWSHELLSSSTTHKISINQCHCSDIQ